MPLLVRTGKPKYGLFLPSFQAKTKRPKYPNAGNLGFLHELHVLLWVDTLCVIRPLGRAARLSKKAHKGL